MVLNISLSKIHVFMMIIYLKTVKYISCIMKMFILIQEEEEEKSRFLTIYVLSVIFILFFGVSDCHLILHLPGLLPSSISLVFLLRVTIWWTTVLLFSICWFFISCVVFIWWSQAEIYRFQRTWVQRKSIKLLEYTQKYEHIASLLF